MNFTSVHSHLGVTCARYNQVTVPVEKLAQEIPPRPLKRGCTHFYYRVVEFFLTSVLLGKPLQRGERGIFPLETEEKMNINCGYDKTADAPYWVVVDGVEFRFNRQFLLNSFLANLLPRNNPPVEE